MRRLWTEEELLKVLRLYCQIPFGKLHSRNPDIISIANEIGRTPSSIALKMVNLASLDPTIAQAGMANASKLDKEVWEKFFDNVDYYLSDSDSQSNGMSDLPQTPFEVPPTGLGVDVLALRKTRSGQQRFRAAVLASYDEKCAISGIGDPKLLVASHIAPWATYPERRLDPRNGICLNALWDRAFDVGLISFSNDYELLFSGGISTLDMDRLTSSGNVFCPPQRFLPDVSLLKAHRERFGFL